MNNNTELIIKRAIPSVCEDALELIKELDEELHQRYPGSSVHLLDLSKITDQNGLFLDAYFSRVAVGCCSIRPDGIGIGEIKHVFVKPGFRRQGISQRMMVHLEEQASQQGYQILCLETGANQPEAINLYRKLGYHNIPKFGEYIHK